MNPVVNGHFGKRRKKILQISKRQHGSAGDGGNGSLLLLVVHRLVLGQRLTTLRDHLVHVVDPDVAPVDREVLCKVLQGGPSGQIVGLGRHGFGEYPWLVGYYCGYLLPKQYGGTSKIQVNPVRSSP